MDGIWYGDGLGDEVGEKDGDLPRFGYLGRRGRGVVVFLFRDCDSKYFLLLPIVVYI